MVPIGRTVEAGSRRADIAGTVGWLASADARFVIGANSVIDGGTGAVLPEDTVSPGDRNPSSSGADRKTDMANHRKYSY